MIILMVFDHISLHFAAIHDGEVYQPGKAKKKKGNVTLEPSFSIRLVIFQSGEGWGGGGGGSTVKILSWLMVSWF